MIKMYMIFIGTVLSMTIDLHAGPFLAMILVMILKVINDKLHTAQRAL